MKTYENLIKELVICNEKNLLMYYDSKKDTFHLYYKVARTNVICPIPILEIKKEDMLPAHHSLKLLHSDNLIDIYNIGRYNVNIMTSYSNSNYIVNIVIHDITNNCKVEKTLELRYISIKDSFDIVFGGKDETVDAVRTASIVDKLFSSDDDDDENALY